MLTWLHTQRWRGNLEVKYKDIPSYILEMFDYSESSPSGLVWKINKFRGNPPYIFINKGDTAGSMSKRDGYYRVCILNIGTFYVHRIIWAICNNNISPSSFIDHIDGDRGNNIIGNLRLVDKRINSRNQKMTTLNSSGFPGIKLRLYLSKKTNCYNHSWIASWTCHLTQKQKTKTFTAKGDDIIDINEKLELAINFREEQILKMNNQGAGYTERHIKGK